MGKLLILSATCLVLFLEGVPSVAALIAVIIIYALILWSQYHSRAPMLPDPHSKRFTSPSYDNPAGNMLPYFSMDQAKRRTPSSAIDVTQGIPSTVFDRVFGRSRLGARDIIPVDHVADKAGYATFALRDLTSCKDDRLACTVVPNAAIKNTVW